MSVSRSKLPLVKNPTSIAVIAPTTLPCQKVEMNTGPIIDASSVPDPRMPSHDNMKGGAYIIISRESSPRPTTATRLTTSACGESCSAFLLSARRRSCDVAADTVCSIEFAVDCIAKMMNSVIKPSSAGCMKVCRYIGMAASACASSGP